MNEDNKEQLEFNSIILEDENNSEFLARANYVYLNEKQIERKSLQKKINSLNKQLEHKKEELYEVNGEIDRLKETIQQNPADDKFIESFQIKLDY